MNVSN